MAPLVTTRRYDPDTKTMVESPVRMLLFGTVPPTTKSKIIVLDASISGVFSAGDLGFGVTMTDLPEGDLSDILYYDVFDTLSEVKEPTKSFSGVAHCSDDKNVAVVGFREPLVSKYLALMIKAPVHPIACGCLSLKWLFGFDSATPVKIGVCPDSSSESSSSSTVIRSSSSSSSSRSSSSSSSRSSSSSSSHSSISSLSSSSSLSSASIRFPEYWITSPSTGATDTFTFYYNQFSLAYTATLPSSASCLGKDYQLDSYFILSGNAILEYDYVGNLLSTHIHSGMTSANDIAVDVGGGYAYLLNSSTIQKIALSTGNVVASTATCTGATLISSSNGLIGQFPGSIYVVGTALPAYGGGGAVHRYIASSLSFTLGYTGQYAGGTVDGFVQDGYFYLSNGQVTKIAAGGDGMPTGLPGSVIGNISAAGNNYFGRGHQYDILSSSSLSSPSSESSLSSLSSVAQSLYWSYSLSGGNATITGYSGPSGDVTVPAALNGHPVTSIAFLALYNHPGVTKVIIPATVTSIGNGALQTDPAITGVYFLGDAPSVSQMFGGLYSPTIYRLTSASGWPTVPDPWPTTGDPNPRPTAIWDGVHT